MSVKVDIQQELNSSRLLEAARKVAGYEDLGDPSLIGLFENFLQCSARDVKFSDGGLAGFKGDAIRILVNRLRMRADFLAHPEIEDEVVDDPIFVVGLVRSGTTKLQRLLSADSGLLSAPLWQVLYPGRTKELANGAPDTRLAEAIRAGGFAQGPTLEAIQAAHAMDLEAPDEDIILFEGTFDHLYLYLRNASSSYLDWVRTRSMRKPYEYYRTVLKYLQWQNGGRQGRPWALKTTTHSCELELLFELFPKATVVHCHRDPFECLPSYARLQELTWSLRGDVDPPEVIGQSMLDVWSDVMRRSVESRARVANKYPVLDVRYSDIKDDALSVVRKIYDVAGRDLTAAAEASMRKWEADNQQHKFGRHQYTAEYFGLSREKVDAEFAAYLKEYGQFL